MGAHGVRPYVNEMARGTFTGPALYESNGHEMNLNNEMPALSATSLTTLVEGVRGEEQNPFCRSIFVRGHSLTQKPIIRSESYRR